jgi:hypothetical protein
MPANPSVLKKLGTCSDKGALLEHYASGNVAARVHNDAAGENGFVAESAAKIGKSERFKNEVYGPDYACRDNAPVAKLSRGAIEDGGRMH